jgi:hypothetical protein
MNRDAVHAMAAVMPASASGPKLSQQWDCNQENWIVGEWQNDKSASTIANGFLERFGIKRTRNSIISKLNQCGQIGKGKLELLAINRRLDCLRDGWRARPVYPMPHHDGRFGPSLPLPQDEPIPSTAVTLENRCDDHCAWPVNHGDPFLYCGASAPGSASYCAHHLRMKRKS